MSGGFSKKKEGLLLRAGSVPFHGSETGLCILKSTGVYAVLLTLSRTFQHPNPFQRLQNVPLTFSIHSSGFIHWSEVKLPKQTKVEAVGSEHAPTSGRLSTAITQTILFRHQSAHSAGAPTRSAAGASIGHCSSHRFHHGSFKRAMPECRNITSVTLIILQRGSFSFLLVDIMSFTSTVSGRWECVWENSQVCLFFFPFLPS